MTSVLSIAHLAEEVVAWGEASMLDAERRLLSNALLDPGNERFVLLSESCVPLYGFPAVYSYLTRSRASFVGAFDDPRPSGRGRYRDGLAPEVRREQFRKGAQWFELDRALAVGVVADDRYYPKFREHCRPPCYVDEHYLPTALSIEALDRIANRSVTWVDCVTWDCLKLRAALGRQTRGDETERSKQPSIGSGEVEWARRHGWTPMVEGSARGNFHLGGAKETTRAREAFGIADARGMSAKIYALQRRILDVPKVLELGLKTVG